MATQAQVLANVANAQRSTGPRSEEGKSRSSRNAISHGFAAAGLCVAGEDRPFWEAMTAALIEDCNPQGALEIDALHEFRDAAWRLRQIRAYTYRLFLEHGGDPLVHPETAVEMRQLGRYRASAEMSLHRAIETLRDLQTIRLGRVLHLAKSENEAIGPLASPKVFARMCVDGAIMDRPAREWFDSLNGIEAIQSPPSVFANSKPIETNSVKMGDGPWAARMSPGQ